MAPFTKEMLLEDFGAGMEVLAEVLYPVLGAAAEDLLQPGAVQTPLAGRRLAEALPGGDLLADAYDFAFEGRLRHSPFRDEADEIDGLVTLFEGLERTVSHERRAFELCVRTLRMAHHRLFFMPGSISISVTSRGVLQNYLLLTELAYMAGLDDKTLRNMTSDKHPNPLKTVKIDGRTYVSLNVALPFLSARGFKPTVIEDYRPERDFAADAFASSADLAEYVRRGRERLALDTKSLALQAGKNVRAEDIEALEMGNASANEDVLEAVAKALGVRDKEGFVSSALDLHRQFYDTLPSASQ